MATTYAIPDGKKHFGIDLWVGTGATNTRNNMEFAPDFFWAKIRDSGGGSHQLFDSVRGGIARLVTNTTAAEATTANGFVALTANGFTLDGSGGGGGDVNYTARSYAGWLWKAGGTAVSNTAGSITSSVSANPTAGFSVVTYTGTGANATVGHGLGVAPAFIIGKKRSAAGSWQTYVSAIPNMATGYIVLNGTGGWTSNSTIWNGTAPTSTVFSLGTDTDLNANGATNVAYCFAPVAGYSAFGKYTGNGSADGPFVYLGFRPRYVLVKRTDVAADWQILDSGRSSYNLNNLDLYANLSNAEEVAGATVVDFTANGFKLRGTHPSGNASGGTYIYMAFAENPFKYANAR